MADIFRDLVFYMSPGPNKAAILKLITEHGGSMAKHCSSNVLLLVDLSHADMIPSSQWPMFSTKLVEESVAQKRFLNPKGFQIKLNEMPFDPKDRPAARVPYRPEEDLILMKYFNENRGKNSLSFFNEMQRKGILQRTGESMKNRFKSLRLQPAGYFENIDKTVVSRNQNSCSRLPKAVEEAMNESDEVAALLEVDNVAVASKMVDTLRQRTGRPVEVIIHALLIFSGNVEKARQYLTSAVTLGAWTVIEDNVITEGGDQDEKSDTMTDGENDDDELKGEALRELLRYRSQEELDDRSKFLTSVSGLLY